MATEKSARERLLKTATALLARSGYRDLGVTELLESSQVTAGSLYHHFPGGKEELAATAIRDFGNARRAVLDQLLAENEPADAIRGMFDMATAGIERSRWRLGCPVGTPAGEVSNVGELVARAIRESFDLWIEVLAAAMTDRGVAMDEAARLAAWCIASYEGAVLLCRAQRDTTVMTDAANRVVRDIEAASAAQQQPDGRLTLGWR